MLLAEKKAACFAKSAEPSTRSSRGRVQSPARTLSTSTPSMASWGETAVQLLAMHARPIAHGARPSPSPSLALVSSLQQQQHLSTQRRPSSSRQDRRAGPAGDSKHKQRERDSLSIQVGAKVVGVRGASSGCEGRVQFSHLTTTTRFATSCSVPPIHHHQPSQARSTAVARDGAVCAVRQRTSFAEATQDAPADMQGVLLRRL